MLLRRLLGLGSHLLPESLIMNEEVRETEALSPEPGRHIKGRKRRLDEDRAGSAHRINEVRAPVPAGSPHHDGCEVLLNRRCTGLRPVLAAVQGLAAYVDADGYMVLPVQVDIDEDIRVTAVNRGPRALLLPEAVDDRVLYLHRAVLSAPDLAVLSGERHGDGLLHREQILPGVVADAEVEREIVISLEIGEAEENPR